MSAVALCRPSKSAGYFRRSTPANLRVRFSDREGGPKVRVRPKTASVMTRQECERVLQVEEEPVRRLQPHLPARKTRPPPWQKALDDHPPSPPKSSMTYREVQTDVSTLRPTTAPLPCAQPSTPPTHISPGYAMSRSKSKIAVTIKTDGFFDQINDSQQKRGISRGDAERPISRSKSSFTRIRSSGSLQLGTVVETTKGPHSSSKEAMSDKQHSARASENAEATGVVTNGWAREEREDARDSLIAQLQDQMRELQFLLEEEQLSHRLTKQRAEEIMHDKLQEATNQHDDEAKRLIQDNDEAMADQKKTLETETENMKDMYEQQTSKARTDLEFIKGAFETFKTQLHIEFDEKWRRREEEKEVEFEKQKTEALENLRQRAVREKNSEKVQVQRDFQAKMQHQDKEHKRELEAMSRRFSNAGSELKRLQEELKTLQGVKAEHEEISERYVRLEEQHAEALQNLTDTKLQLFEFETSFNAKVGEVDDQYREKIHDLMTQNSELRRQYMKKCRDLFDEKTENDRQMEKRVSTAKTTMEHIINARTRAEVSLAPCDPEADKLSRVQVTRPASAPLTRAEEIQAQRQAGQTDHITKNKGLYDKPKGRKPK